MLLAAGVAFYKAWRIHTGPYALLACGLGIVALGLAVWHLASSSRRLPRPRS